MLKNKYFYLIVVTSLAVLVDQGAKWLVRAHIQERFGRIEVIPGFFRLVHAENEGAAWGLLSEASYRIPFFIVATLIAFVVIGVFFVRLPKGKLSLAVALASILGGAIGNFIDRVLYQSVTDFLEFYISYPPIKRVLIQIFGSYRWPAFNIADVAIVVGISIVLYDAFVIEPREMKAREEADREEDSALQQEGHG